jgi:heat shock protein HslJ
MKLRLLLLLAMATGCAEYQPRSALAQAQSPANTPPLYVLPSEMLEKQWQWVGGTSGGTNVLVTEPARYTIRFTSQGRIEVRADCNRGVGNYAVQAQQELSLGPLALTRAMCLAGSQGDQFIQMLTSARTYSLQDGHLRLSLPENAGEMLFDEAP